MASKLKALALVLIGVATLLHGTAAQTRHVVGGGTGWTIPSGGASTYTTWASNQSFNVGDTLGKTIPRLIPIMETCLWTCA